MKPEQLNRLIRVNGRMQPWFLRNTSELYESAVRSYYKLGRSSVMPHSTHNRHLRSLRLEENVSSLRKVKTAATESSTVDDYPRNHRLQADHAASITPGQLLHTVMQARRRRSMSFSVGGAKMDSPSNDAHQYWVFEQSPLGDSSSSSSERSQGGILMDKLPRCLRRTRETATAKRERKRMGRRSCREIDVGNGHQLGMDMKLISARSLSLPPLSGQSMGDSNMRQMQPSRQHHMKAIEKSTLANAALRPSGEADSLITVDEALKRRISVIDHAVKRRRTSAELGHLMTGGNTNRSAKGSLGGVARLPSKMPFRFHTLGDRIKQFEYIQFPDGPVTSYAFNRRQQSGAPQVHRVPEGGSTSSSFSRTDNPMQNATNLGQEEQQTKIPQRPRPLCFHNVLHANHRQRRRSLKAPRGSLPLSLPTVEQDHAPPHGPLGIPRNTRGSSLYSSSRTSISAWRNTVGTSSATSVPNLVSNLGSSLPLMATNTNGTSAKILPPHRGLTPGGKSLRTESTQESSRPINETIAVLAANSKPMTREFRKSTATPKQSLNSGVNNDSTWGTSIVNNSRGSSTANLDSRRSSIDALLKEAPKNNLETASGAFCEKSSPDIAHNEPARLSCAPVRQVQLQQRSLQMDSPAEEISLCLTKVKSKAKPRKKPLEIPKAEPRVSNLTSNQVSRSSHRAFFQAPHNDLSAGSPPNKNHRKQQTMLEIAEKNPEHWEKNLDKQNWEHGSRAIAVPSLQPEKQSAHRNGINHLLVASASQVSAYKRAFRTQQQMQKAEILHQQAQPLQKPKPKPKPSPSLELSSLSNQQSQAEDVRPTQLWRPQRRCGPIPTTSRAIRPFVCTAANRAGRNGALLTEEWAKPTMEGKAVAAPVATPLTVVGTRTTATSAAEPALTQKTKPISAAQASATTGEKRAVAGAATAASSAETSKTRVKGGEGRRLGVRRGAEGATTKRLLALTQHQHSRNDHGSRNSSSLLGFRSEAVNRSASSLLQRRDESKQSSQSQSPSQLRSAQRQQQRQQQQPQRRHFYFECPPWRPSY